MDFTKEEYLPNWMEFDRMYLFKMKLLKKEINNIMIPYQRTIDIIKATNIIFVDTYKFTIRIDYEDKVDFIVFENVIEAWKFYGYITTLFYNARETQNSLTYDIGLNLRILFDDLKFTKMENVFMILVNKYNIKFNRELAEKTKIPIEEDQINFKAISEFYEIFLIAYYSLADYANNFEKLRIFINRFHELYFDFIKELLTNPYTEVT